jgi:hypothetical protein
MPRGAAPRRRPTPRRRSHRAADQLGGELELVVEVGEHDEVVRGAVGLGELHPPQGTPTAAHGDRPASLAVPRRSPVPRRDGREVGTRRDGVACGGSGSVSRRKILIVVLVVALVGVTWTVRSRVPGRSFPRGSSRSRASTGRRRRPAGRARRADASSPRHGGPLLRAQGFVHAQDRFWEMDFRRHVTAGRLSELFGDSQLDTDRFVRTLGWRRVAEAGAGAARRPTRCGRSRPTRRGQRLDRRQARLRSCPSSTPCSRSRARAATSPSPGSRPTRWRGSRPWRGTCAPTSSPSSSAVACRASSTGPGRRALPRLPLRPSPHHPARGGDRGRRGGRDVVRPRADAASTRHEASTTAPTRPRGGQCGRWPRPRCPGRGRRTGAARDAGPPRLRGGDGIGSNSWVIAPERSASGSALLANDPHLGPGQPSLWYQVGLRCEPVGEDCPYHAEGFSFSGFPGVVIGHNDRIAWGFTNLGPDVADVFLERLDGDRYLTEDGWEPLEIIEETIGSPAATRSSSRCAPPGTARCSPTSATPGPRSPTVRWPRPTSPRRRRTATGRSSTRPRWPGRRSSRPPPPGPSCR